MSTDEIEFKEGIKEINAGDYDNFKDCKKAYIPKSVIKICDNAFKDYTNLEEVYIPNTVKTIGKYAFSGCIKLKNVKLSEGLDKIGSYAFDKTAIETITIPATIRNINEKAFGYDDCKIGKIIMKGYAPKDINKVIDTNKDKVLRGVFLALEKGNVYCSDGKTKFIAGLEIPPLYNGKNPQPSDVKQRSGGKCYFMAAIASIAKDDPSAIQKCISYSEKTKVAEVTLYRTSYNWKKGELYTIMPLSPVKIKVSAEQCINKYARDNAGALWPMIMEYAYTDIYLKKYADKTSLESNGRTSFVMASITGKKQKLQMTFGNFDLVKEIILNEVNRTAVVISIAAYSKNDREELDNLGLVQPHAYSVMDAEEKSGDLILTLRNPHKRMHKHNHIDENDKGLFKISFDKCKKFIIDINF